MERRMLAGASTAFKSGPGLGTASKSFSNAARVITQSVGVLLLPVFASFSPGAQYSGRYALGMMMTGASMGTSAAVGALALASAGSAAGCWDIKQEVTKTKAKQDLRNIRLRGALFRLWVVDNLAS